MPRFKPKTIGDFHVEIQPVGRFRSFCLVKWFLPYFAGDEPKLKVNIKRKREDKPDLSFNAELLRIDPFSDTAIQWLRLANKKTPFEEIVVARMLENDGNYVFEVKIDGVGRESVALLPVKTRAVIVVGIFCLFIGAGLMFLGQYIMSCLGS